MLLPILTAACLAEVVLLPKQVPRGNSSSKRQVSLSLPPRNHRDLRVLHAIPPENPATVILVENPLINKVLFLVVCVIFFGKGGYPSIPMSKSRFDS